MVKIQVFQKKVKKGEGHKVKHYSTKWQVLSQGIYMWNMKDISLKIYKLWQRLTLLFTQLTQSPTEGPLSI